MQLTPPGSACSITHRHGHHDAAPGSAAGPRTSSSPTSRRPARSSSAAASRSSDFRSTSSRGPDSPGADPQHARLRLVRRRSPTPTATAGWCRRSGTARAGRVSTARPPATSRLRGAHRAAPARAARPLLPDARLVRRGRGRGAGDVPAGLAQPRPVRRGDRCSGPGSTGSPPTCASTMLRRRSRATAAALARSPRCRGSSPTPTRCSTRSRRGDDAARRRRRRAGDDRARLPRRAAGAPAAPAGGADRPRRARLAGRRRPRRCSRRASRRRTARCSGPGRRCSSTCRRSRADWSAGADAHETSASCSARFIDAHERVRRRGRGGDRRADIRITMPPLPAPASTGSPRSPRCSSAPSGPTATATGGSCPRRPTGCRPAASYLRRPGDTEFRAFKFDVLRIEDGAIAEITTFGPAHFEALGLPPGCLTPTRSPSAGRRCGRRIRRGPVGWDR